MRRTTKLLSGASQNVPLPCYDTLVEGRRTLGCIVPALYPLASLKSNLASGSFLYWRSYPWVISLIGDFTGMIGDPSGCIKARPTLTQQKLKESAATYAEQAHRVFARRFQSEEQRLSALLS
ncbi:MAG: hypothetical protein OXF66_02890 [Gammaproteobacteria bacterium]|nr:hypothetical protein [Gammaproteobacteria bacterium]